MKRDKIGSPRQLTVKRRHFPDALRYISTHLFRKYAEKGVIGRKQGKTH